MPIFRLEGNDITEAKLVHAQETDLELESYLEDWLENSPPALAQEQIMWIGRQTSASVEKSTIFPDLLGVDSAGNLVIVELKRDQAPREVIAQLLEYAAWANELSDEQIKELAVDYFQTRDETKNKHFNDAFKDVFDIPESDELPPLNQNLRLFIIAGEIPARVTNVCRFLRTSHGINIHCINISTYQTESGEKFVSLDTKVGDEDLFYTKTKVRSGKTLSHQMVFDAILEYTNGDHNVIFSLKDIEEVVSKKYPGFGITMVRNRIRGDCVSFPSRNNYPKGEDRYWWVEKNKYRLYDSVKDKKEENTEKKLKINLECIFIFLHSNKMCTFAARNSCLKW